MILVIGATGMVGGEVCRLIATKGESVSALVRATSDPAKVNDLEALGVKTIEGDLRDVDSLVKACEGVSKVISTASSMPFSYQPGENDIDSVDTKGQMNLIDAALKTGVKHLIYISFTMENQFPLRDAKRKVESYLKESGVTYTILRPGYFMEVWLSPAVGFDPANAKAQIYGLGTNPISWISLQDVAKFAVACLDNPAAKNVTLPIGGPEAISQLEMVKIFEEIGGKNFDVQLVPEDALEEQLKSATDPMQQSFTGLMLWYAKGDPIEMESTLQDFPMELVTVKQYAQRVLG